MIPIRPSPKCYLTEEQILHLDLSHLAKSELERKEEGGGRAVYIGVR
jgi:hypothetical protein